MGSNVTKLLLPAAASFFAPGIGSALSSGLGLGLGSIGSAALGGAVTGGLGSALTGGNILTGALTGGAGGGLNAGLFGAGGLLGPSSGAGLDSGTGITWNSARPDSFLDSVKGGFSNLTDSIGLTSGGGASSYGAGSQSSFLDDLFGSPTAVGQNTAGNFASGLDPKTGITWNPLTQAGSNAINSGGAAATGGGGFFDNILKGSGGSGMNIGDLLGGLNSYSAQDDIAKQQREALQQAQGLFAPYQQTGQQANSQLSALLGLGGPEASQSAMSALTSTPGYQFRFNQGQTALERNLAAQGLSNSGAAQKAITDYGQGQAQQSYQDAINNYLGVSNTGQSAAGSLADIFGNIGQVNASKTAQQSNILNQGIGSIFGGANDPSSDANLLNQLLRRQSAYA